MVAIVTDALTTLGPDLLKVAGVGLGIGLSLFGLKKGVGVAKSFIKG